MFKNRCFDMGGRDQFMYNQTQFNSTQAQYNNGAQNQYMDNNESAANNMMGDDNNCDFPGVMCPPVYECPQERCCHRQIHHKVEQDCVFM